MLDWKLLVVFCSKAENFFMQQPTLRKATTTKGNDLWHWLYEHSYIKWNSFTSLLHVFVII